MLLNPIKAIIIDIKTIELSFYSHFPYSVQLFILVWIRWNLKSILATQGTRQEHILDMMPVHLMEPYMHIHVL